jgi:predicted nucleotidyltransferase component of viral defense system
MNSNVASLRAFVAEAIRRAAIPAEMEQNVMKEVIHLHILSALSDARVLERVVFQGGTALRLCNGGERYSEDLDFVCGANGSYLGATEFEEIVHRALGAATQTLAKNFGLSGTAVELKDPDNVAALRLDEISVAAWQIRVPIDATSRAPRSFIEIEFANVPSYDNSAAVITNRFLLPDIPNIILRAEQPMEILADKAVALTVRPVLKHRDIWDIWFLRRQLSAKVNRAMTELKIKDYKTVDVVDKARDRIKLLSESRTEIEFIAEMSRFLPKTRVDEIKAFALTKTILSEAATFLREAVLPAST